MQLLPENAEGFTLFPSHLRRLVDALTPLAMDGWGVALYVNWVGDGSGRRWISGSFTAQATKLMVKDMAAHELAGLIVKRQADTLDEAVLDLIAATHFSMQGAFYKSLGEL